MRRVLVAAIVIAAAASLGFTWASAAAPNTTITAHPPSATKSHTATFQFTSSPAGASFECSPNRTSAYSPCTSGTTYMSLPDGSYTFRVRAKNAGGTDPTPASWSWKVDNVPPVVGKPGTGFQNYLGTGATVEAGTAWLGSDALSGINHYQLFRRTGTTWSSVPLSPPTAYYAYEYVPAGQQMVYAVRAFDNAGNVSTFQVGSPFGFGIVDDSSPSITWTGTWHTISSSAYHGGTARFSSTANSSAQITTSTARAVGFVTDRAPNRGSVEVTFHAGGYPQDVTGSLYAATFEPRLIWASYGTNPAPITVKARVTGTFAPPSSSANIVVDAFVVLY